MTKWLGGCLLLLVGGCTAESVAQQSSATGGSACRLEAAAGTAGTQVPEEIAARQQVTFQLTNDTGTRLFVPSAGFSCDLFGIQSSQDGSALPLSLGDRRQCLCNPSCESYRAHASHFVSLEPGATLERTWDARALDVWEAAYYLCESDCTPTVETMGVAQPVQAGPYVATFGFELTQPNGCSIAATDDTTGAALECYTSFGFPSAVAARCETRETVSVAFDLPDSGALVVPVSIK